jgi:hypothetical protein
MKALTILVVGTCAMTPCLCAQQRAASLTNSLKSTDKVELTLSRAQLQHPAKCDAVGNVYARPIDITLSGPKAARELRDAPIRQITPKGNVAAAFGPTEALQDAKEWGIFVNNSGDVYRAASAHGSVYVVEFSKDGSPKSMAELLGTPTHVDPWHLVVFPSGRFLLSGESGKNARTPYTAVFEANGKLVREIYEPEDENARSRAEMGDTDFARAAVGNLFVHRGDATLGSDGNAYLLHSTSPALIYVISPAGEVIRKLRVDAGDSVRKLGSIKSYAGKLAISFEEFGHVRVYVTDLEGNSIATYSMGTEKSDALDLACYDSWGFTFVSSDAGNNLYLIKAQPE